MATLADPYFDRYRAHVRACLAGCRSARSHEDESLCRVGAALGRAWLNAEVRYGNPNIRQVEESP